MIGFLFDVDEVIFEDNGKPLYTNSWSTERLSPVSGKTVQPKFNLPERVEQAVYPEGANKYADKYGYAKLAYANYKEDRPNTNEQGEDYDQYDPKYYRNYNVYKTQYLGQFFWKLPEKRSSIYNESETLSNFPIKTDNTLNNKYISYPNTNRGLNLNDGTLKYVTDLLFTDFNLASIPIFKDGDNELSEYNNKDAFDFNLSKIKENLGEVFNLQSIPNFNRKDSVFSNDGYLIFTHRVTGYRFIVTNVTSTQEFSLSIRMIYKPNGDYLIPIKKQEDYNSWANNFSNRMFSNFSKRYSGSGSSIYGYNDSTKNDVIQSDNFIMLSYDKLYNNKLTDESNIITSAFGLGDINYYGTKANGGHIYRKDYDGIAINFFVDESNMNNERKLIGYNRNLGKYAEYAEADHEFYDSSTNFKFYLGRMFKEISNPDIWKIGDNEKTEDDFNDPYENGGSSTEGGGDGKFDDINDKIDSNFDLSDISTTISNMIAIWLPTADNMDTISRTLNSTDFLGGITNYFSGFDKYLISINAIPAAIPATGIRTMMFRSQIVCGNVPYTKNTLITKPMGSIKVEPYYGNALDYQATYDLYLPFIGNHRLQAEDVVNKQLSIIYRIDVVTGACLARVYSDGTCRYEFSGNCAYTIPINVESYNSTIQALIQATASIGAGIASGGNAVIGSIGASQAANLAMNIANKDMQYRGGGGTGNAAFLGTNFPYLTITRINMSNPSSYNKFYGYPSNITETLGNLRGFTKVDAVHLEGIKATQNELKEIEQLLKDGVIC